MEGTIDHDVLDVALRRCGSNWDAAQTHGLLSGRLAIAGSDGGFGWLAQVLEGTSSNDVLRQECEHLLEQLFETTYRQLDERLSRFEPLLPRECDSLAIRAAALGRWCEGFLHGLVDGDHGDALRARLADEPLADIVRDMLQMTRATVGGDGEDEAVEEAYAELVEYLRVAAQLTYEELVEFRTGAIDGGLAVDDPEMLH